MVFPHFDYCSLVWSSFTAHHHNGLQILHDELTRVLRMPCRRGNTSGTRTDSEDWDISGKSWIEDERGENKVHELQPKEYIKHQHKWWYQSRGSTRLYFDGLCCNTWVCAALCMRSMDHHSQVSKGTRWMLHSHVKSCLQHPLEVAYITNAELYGSLPKITQKIRDSRIRFAGHCSRSVECVSKLVHWTP